MNILSLITGIVIGLVFKLLKLEVPAPANFDGILGIIGLWMGYYLLIK